jgi:protein-L-isoaspartate O-methyltransferase
VYSFESSAAIADTARRNLARTGFGNVVVVDADDVTGTPPVVADRTIATAGFPCVPPSWWRALAHTGALWALARTGPTYARTVDGLRHALVDGITRNGTASADHEFDLIRGMAGVVQLARVLVPSGPPAHGQDRCASAAWLEAHAYPTGC